MIEAGVVVDNKHNPIHWHLPPDRSAGALPDSRELWDIFWDNRETVAGFAHTHPWNGEAWPSSTDLSTFRAIELALGRTLVWWVVTFDHVAWISWNTVTQAYDLRPVLEPSSLPWVARLRELSTLPASAGRVEGERHGR